MWILGGDVIYSIPYAFDGEAFFIITYDFEYDDNDGGCMIT
jgi:hypothetical protein